MPPEALDRVRQSYDRVAHEYAERYAEELSHKPLDRALLGLIVTERARGSVVADVGCGPGHVTRHLHDRGAPCVGLDVSPAMIHLARQRNPGIDFIEGSMLGCPLPTAHGGRSSRCTP